MVDPVSSASGKGPSRPVAAVTATSPAARATAAADPRTPATPDTGIGGLAKAMAARPPVDADRVARIKKAVQDGRFPILPALVADRLIALKLEWTPNEQA